MGYRSDVTLGVAFPSMEDLVAFVTKIKLAGTMPPEEWEHYYTTPLDGGAALLHATFNDVKWYESYPDVQGHIAMYGQANSDEYATAFVRIGEGQDDTVVEIIDPNDEYYLWDYFNVRRELIAPEGGEPLIKGDN